MPKSNNEALDDLQNFLSELKQKNRENHRIVSRVLLWELALEDLRESTKSKPIEFDGIKK